MKQNQKGFAAMGALILLVVVGVIMGTGYYVVSKQNPNDSSASIIPVTSAVEAKKIEANGTATNTIQAATQQVDIEIANEEDGLAKEDAVTSSVTSQNVEAVGGSADVSKL